MPIILKPFEVEKIASDLIRGTIPDEDRPVNPRERAKLALNQAGASIEDAAEGIAQVLRDEEDAGKRMKAVEMAMKIHDVIVNDNKPSVPQISIQILGSEKTLVQLVTPV